MSLPTLLLALACATAPADAVSDLALGQFVLRAAAIGTHSAPPPHLPAKEGARQLMIEGPRPLNLLQLIAAERTPASTGLMLAGGLQLVVVVVAMVFCCEGTAGDASIDQSRRSGDASTVRTKAQQRTGPPNRTGTANISRGAAGAAATGSGPLQGPAPNPPAQPQPYFRGTEKGWSTPEPEPGTPSSTCSLDGPSLPLGLKEAVLCPALAELARGRGPEKGSLTLVLSAELGSQPQDGWLAVSDPSTGDVVAKAYASESGPEPGVLLDADRGGYFAFLDTSGLYEQPPQVNRRILLRRASMSSLPVAPYAVMFLNTGSQSKTLVARRGWAAGEALLSVNMDAAGRVVDVADGFGRRIAECEQHAQTAGQSEAGPPVDRLPAYSGILGGGLGVAGGPRGPGATPEVVVRVEGGADVGLVLCALLAAQKLR